MRYRYHRLVPRDVNLAMAWYEENASVTVADEFFEELVEAIQRAAASPTSHHSDSFIPSLRRVNLKQFPYHFLYQIRTEHIYVVVVRHDKRHPGYGLRRKY